MTLIQVNGPPFKLITNCQTDLYRPDSDQIHLKNIRRTDAMDVKSYDCELYCQAILDGQTSSQCAHCPFWHQIHHAWELVLKNQFHQAYNLLYQSQAEATTKQESVVQFILAMVDSLSGCYENAEPVLAQAPPFFHQHHATPQAFSAQIHLAYLYLQTERSEHAHKQIEQVLHWLSSMKIADIQISWWHLEVIAHTLAYAIAHSIYPHTARHIFMQQIGQTGKDVLLPYLYQDDVVVQKNVYNFYSVFDDSVLELVPKSNNLRVRQSIHQLLHDGTLRPEGFSSLKKALTTATQQNRPNAALIATFGLYIARYSRVEIAKRLDMSPSSIRNYITTIYEIFNLDQHSYNGQLARFQHLQEIAQDKGYIA